MSNAIKQTTIPVIDISKLDGSESDRKQLIEDLRFAAHDVGFFYISGHNIPKFVTDNILSETKKFFNHPVEEKAEIDNINSKQFRGYTRFGYELTNGTPDRREQIDIGPERESIYEIAPEKRFLGLVGPNQWPTFQPSLKPAVQDWLKYSQEISLKVLSALALTLELPENFFEQWFDEQSHFHTKLIRYEGQGNDSSNQGVGAHKDYGFLALLLQDNVGGLQVQTLDGEWVDAPPIEDTFVFNIGEVLEIITNGYFRATVHRVLSPKGNIERFSIPFFYGPRLDAVITPIKLSAELTAQSRGIEADPNNPLIANYGENSLKGWLRAHPKVAEKYWN